MVVGKAGVAGIALLRAHAGMDREVENMAGVVDHGNPNQPGPYYYPPGSMVVENAPDAADVDIRFQHCWR